jgi:hypothetical protein
MAGLSAGEAAKERFHAARFHEARDDHEGEEARHNDHQDEQHEENVRHHRPRLLRMCERAQRTTQLYRDTRCCD